MPHTNAYVNNSKQLELDGDFKNEKMSSRT